VFVHVRGNAKKKEAATFMVAASFCAGFKS
jgi:hypothetical protein